MLYLHCSRIMGRPQWADMGMWLQSVMLLLVERGLASCPQECWAMYGGTVRATLGLGDDQILFSGLAIGYADEAALVNKWPVPRVDLEEEIDRTGFARVDRKQGFFDVAAQLPSAVERCTANPPHPQS